MSLVETPSFAVTSARIKSAQLSGDAYVLSLASLPSYYAAASSASANNIHLFDKADLRKILDLSGHDKNVSQMRSVRNIASSGREALVSCGKDGAVKVWDERSGSVALESKGLPCRHLMLGAELKECTSANSARICFEQSEISIIMRCFFRRYDRCCRNRFARRRCSSTILVRNNRFLSVALYLLSLTFRDPRNPAAPRRIHSYTHSDDITAVHFLKPSAGQSYPNIVLSVSSDGLLCTSNPEEDDEDEAGLHVGNWGTSIAQAGWIHGQSNTPRIWSSSDMETFGIWSSEVGS